MKPRSTLRSIRVPSPGNFEPKLRLPRQNRNTLVNLPRQILSHFFTRITDFSQVTETDIDLPRQNSRTLFKVPRRNFGLGYTLVAYVMYWITSFNS